MGYNYKPIWYQPTARGGAMAARERMQDQIQEEYREEIGKSGMTREEREAIEADRIRELAANQISAADWHGYGSEHYIPPISAVQRFAHSDPYGGYTNWGYRPPTGWNYETDTPQISYYQYFGEPSLEELDEGNKEIDELLASDAFSNVEKDKLLQLKKDWNAGEISPHSLKVKDMYADANVKNRTEREELFEENDITVYSADRLPKSLAEAKAYADAVYMESLQNSLNSTKWGKGDKEYIEQLIREGAPSFNTEAEINKYYSRKDSDPFKIAADLQKAVMEDFIDRSQNLATDMQDLSYSGETFTIGGGTKAHPITLNTGTLVGAPKQGDVVNVGEFGTYGNYSYNIPKQSGLSKALSVGLKWLSVAQPQLAPVIAGVEAIMTGGDIEDALKAAGTSWATAKLVEIAEPQVADVFDKVGIDVYELPDAVQNVIFDTTIDVIEGESFKEAIRENVAKETLSAVAEPVEEVFEDLGDAIPDALKAPIEFVADTLEPVVDVIDDGIDYVGEQYVDPMLDVVEEFVEPVVDVVQEVAEPVVDVVQEVTEPVIETVQEVGRDIDEEIIQPTLDVVQEVTEPVVDTIDDVIDEFGEEVVDPVLQTTKEVGQDIIDPIDDIIDAVDSPLGDVVETVVDVITPDISGSFTGAGMPSFNIGLTGTGGLLGGSQIGSLFDDDLIKLDKMKSTQEMLTPFINLRKYG